MRADIDTLAERGRRAWPGLRVADERLRAFLAARVPDDLPAEDVRAEDLVLACGCAAGDSVALAAFLSVFDPHVRAVLGRLTASATLREEASHQLAAHLFVAAPGAEPRIAGYTGRGSLLAFVRVTAVRLALGLVRGGALIEHETLDDEILDDRADPELVAMKELYRDEFKIAFAEAVAGLPPRERTLLRYCLVDGLSIDRIGALYGIHRATAARQVADAKNRLAAATQRALMDRLNLEPSDLDSVMRLVMSQLDISVKRLLADGADDGVAEPQVARRRGE